jgi:D-serine deaminase-like pyridoxal phosphate-dependent protein
MMDNDITNIEQIDTPALLIENAILMDNIGRMQAMAEANGVTLRPHIKSHKMPEIAHLQVEAGARGIAVAKLGEAQVMARHGLNDIQVANELVTPFKFERLLALQSIGPVTCAVDSAANVGALAEYFSARDRELAVLIEIDTGLHRCGLQSAGAVVELAKHIDALTGVRLQGLMTHAGHVYGASDREEVERIGRHEGEMTVRLAEAVRSAGIPVEVVSVGSTPTAPYAGAVDGVTEIRPGNYVFNDMIQVSLGAAMLEDCALSVLATVISVPTRDRAVIDAGSKALGTDRGAHGNQKLSDFGHIAGKSASLERLSEEHGVITFEKETFRIRERVRIIPNHACPVANLFEQAWLVDGEKVLKAIPVEARAKMT